MSNVDDVFGTDGLLAQKFKGYQPRRGQVDMARAVADAIAKKQHLIAEGPTGTGKGLAYLVPAIEHATGSHEETRGSRVVTVPNGKVIVVTANIALQEQLVNKDLPLLREILPDPFTFALAKGKNNYLCVDAFGKALAEAGVADAKQLSLVGDPKLARLLAWAQETTTGDVSEFPETPEPRDWKKLSVSSDECKGTACKWYTKCFAESAKRRAQLANVVVTNYHLFFAHLVVRAKMREIAAAGGEVDVDIVLPPADIVIFDEGHKAAEIARDFLGFTIARSRVDWLLRGFNHEIAQQAQVLSDAFFARLAAHKKSRQYRSRLKKGHGIEGAAQFSEALGKVGRFYRDSAQASAYSADEKAELDMRARTGFALSEQVLEAMNPEEHPDIVYFLEENQRGDVGVKSKPIDVSKWLESELFGQFKSVVVTSATLATGSKSDPFGYVRKEIGLVDSPEIVAESPFRWGDQVLLVLPKTMGDPKDYANYPGQVAQHVARIVKQARGRTLGLFTSYKNLEAAHGACADLPYRIYRQGEGPRTLLVQKFRDDVSSVLLGCESFWAGVDVAGESLSCVVIDRIPFPTPDDPIIDAIAERDKNWFFNVAVPRAIIAIKQGFGRLIRSETDRGVVVILDRRVSTMSYGRSFLAALPQTSMADEVEDVGAFLDRGAG